MFACALGMLLELHGTRGACARGGAAARPGRASGGMAAPYGLPSVQWALSSRHAALTVARGQHARSGADGARPPDGRRAGRACAVARAGARDRGQRDAAANNVAGAAASQAWRAAGIAGGVRVRGRRQHRRLPPQARVRRHAVEQGGEADDTSPAGARGEASARRCEPDLPRPAALAAAAQEMPRHAAPAQPELCLEFARRVQSSQRSWAGAADVHGDVGDYSEDEEGLRRPAASSTAAEPNVPTPPSGASAVASSSHAGASVPKARESRAPGVRREAMADRCARGVHGTRAVPHLESMASQPPYSTPSDGASLGRFSYASCNIH